MPTIKVRVDGKIAKNLTPEEKIVCGNEDYEVEFDFDESWASVNFKTGLFIYNGDLVAQPFDGNVCPMPKIENTTLLAIGVKTSDGRLYTTTPAYADCLKSASDLATNKIPAPTKDVYDEIIALINKYISGGGSIDLSDYQKKVDENLPTTNKTIVGAIAEVKEIAETAKMVFGETEGTAYEGNKGKKNADNIEKLKNELSIVNVALEQSGLVKKYIQPITQEYTERVTADGLNVLDGSKAILEKVVGNSVTSKNLFNPFVLSPQDESDTSWIKTVTENEIVIVVNRGYSIQTGKTLQDFCPTLKAGQTVWLNGERSTGGNGAINLSGTASTAWLLGASITITSEHLTAFVSLSHGLSETKEVIFSNLRVTENKNQPFTPYFTGLKSASFGGIESTNADGTETVTLDFPKMEIPLGTTIDFETKKITKEYAYLEQNTPFTEEQLANYTDYIISQDGKSIMYKLSTPIETDFTAEQSANGNEYTAYKGGTEMVLENDGTEYGADNTLTQDYILVTEVG